MSKRKKYSSGRVEWNYVEQLLNSIENEKIKNYIANQIEWHVIRANRYRFYEYLLKILTVVMPTFVGVVEQKLSASSLGVQFLILGTATVTAAAGTFLSLHDKKVLYRKTAEEVREETNLYVNCVGEYKNDEGRDEKFILKIRSIVKDANERWVELENSVEKEAKNVRQFQIPKE